MWHLPWSVPRYRVTQRSASYRSASEDRCVVVQASSRAVVLAVADGVGGQPGGGSAATLAVETVEIEAQALAQRGKRVFSGFLHSLDDALLAHPDAGQTTLIALTLQSMGISGVSVGDSEALWITPGGHFDLTEAQKRKPYLGSGAALPVAFSLKPLPRGRLLMASDGLFKYADSLAITEAVRQASDIEAAADALIALASAPTGRFYDDVVLIVAELA